MTVFYQNGVIDTPFVTVSVDENITVYDKTTHEAYEDVIRFEDRGDIGMSTSISNQRNRAYLRRTQRL